ncbi:MAG: 50S ribosomal protein L22 [Acidobacteriota bacterium]|jgi:large subunit ribosomal protein L22|nr:50S ribosomal protein L22 [Acidobacteriota bacterium]
MEASATYKNMRVSPQKARLVVDLIRGKSVSQALSVLNFTKKRVTHDVEKILRSAIANAEQKAEHLDVDDLVVSKAFVNEGPRQKRVRPAPMGRAYRYQRRTSSITLVVAAPEA